MNKQNKPEIVQIEDQHFGSHVEHWNFLTEQPNVDVPKWLGLALNAPLMPMGLCPNEAEMDQAVWLIQGPNKAAIQLNQVIAVENNKPKAVKTAFPSFESPYRYPAQVERIIHDESNSQAVLRLNLGLQNIVYAFDTLYAVNHDQYQQDATYMVQLNAWAYTLEAVNAEDQLVVDDEASIKHHHALNDILAAHDGVAPDNLQELIDAWEPKSEEDKAPVTINFSKMVAYLYGETLGQEDEAWFQGHIVGKSDMQFMNQDYVLYDVALIHEEDQEAIILRVASKDPLLHTFKIGQYIRGNLWIQASIHTLKP